MSTDLEILPDIDRTPTTLFASPDPAAIVAQATRIAEVIKPLIKQRNLYKQIGQSDHVFLEGWTLAGSMLGVFPATVSSGPMFDTEGNVYGYQATVEARTMAGAVVGRADAECTRDESNKWANAPSFQLRSMAQTRASSKALRMPLGFVMQLAGYDATPAEEMEQAAARGETVTGGRGVRAGWLDINEQQRAHAAVGARIDQHGLREWVAAWIDSKGYGDRPWAKGQLNQLRKAIDREVEQKSGEGEREDVGSHLRPDRHDPSPDPTSPPRLEGEASRVGGTHPTEDYPEDGDALPRSDAEGSGSAAGGQPPDDVAGTVSAGPTPSPVAGWCEANGVDIRLARIHLKKAHASDFGDLKDRKDLDELAGERAQRAVAYLDAWHQAGQEDS